MMRHLLPIQQEDQRRKGLNMPRFIRLQTIAGNDVLINTGYIQSVTINGAVVTVWVAGGGQQDDCYKVRSTLDEVQAIIEQAEAKEMKHA
jgi:hypothetical protein